MALAQCDHLTPSAFGKRFSYLRRAERNKSLKYIRLSRLVDDGLRVVSRRQVIVRVSPVARTRRPAPAGAGRPQSPLSQRRVASSSGSPANIRRLKSSFGLSFPTYAKHLDILWHIRCVAIEGSRNAGLNIDHKRRSVP